MVEGGGKTVEALHKYKDIKIMLVRNPIISNVPNEMSPLELKGH